MLKNTIVVAALACAISAASLAANDPHWTYDGAEDGPAQWGDLKDSEGKLPYLDCKTSTRQSPIDIKLPNTIDPNLPNIEIDFPQDRDLRYPVSVENSGHAIEVTPKLASAITVDGRVFDLKQFHFHTPAEHKLNGKPFDMEIHFVHQARNPSAGQNNKVVVAVLVQGWSSNLPPLDQAGSSVLGQITSALVGPPPRHGEPGLRPEGFVALQQILRAL